MLSGQWLSEPSLGKATIGIDGGGQAHLSFPLSAMGCLGAPNDLV